MNRWLLILLWLVLLSCSSQRQRTRHHTTEQSALHHTRTDSVHSAAWHQMQQWQLQAGRQQVLILPKGDFKYSVDSGFEGSAHYVWMDQISAEASSFGVSDSSGHTSVYQRQFAQVEILDSTMEELQVQRRLPEFQLPGFWKVIALIVLVVSAYWFWRLRWRRLIR